MLQSKPLRLENNTLHLWTVLLCHQDRRINKISTRKFAQYINGIPQEKQNYSTSARYIWFCQELQSSFQEIWKRFSFIGVREPSDVSNFSLVPVLFFALVDVLLWHFSVIISISSVISRKVLPFIKKMLKIQEKKLILWNNNFWLTSHCGAVWHCVSSVTW